MDLDTPKIYKVEGCSQMNSMIIDLEMLVAKDVLEEEQQEKMKLRRLRNA